MEGALAGLVRRREAFTVVWLAVVLAQIVLGVVSFAVDFWPGIEPVVVLAALLSAIWCAAGTPTPHARAFLILAIAGGVASLLVDLVRAIGAGFSSRPSTIMMVFADVLFGQVGSLIAIVAAVMVLVGLGQRATAATPYGQPSGSGADPPVPQPAPLEQRPTWQPDQASGAAWTTAGDAARGAPGTGWENQPPGGSSWQPIPGASTWAPRPDPEAERGRWGGSEDATPERRPEDPR